MRLGVLETGHRTAGRLFIRVVQGLSRKPIDPVVKLALYRPEFFGRPFLAVVAEVMRGPSYWSPAEREHFAAFTSRLNECPFCARVHGEASRIEAQGSALSLGAMRPEATAMLPLLEKATRDASALSGSDIAAVRQAGVGDDAIVEALQVNLVFNTINRVANAFDFQWESDDHARLAAKVIHLIKYKLPAIAMR